MDVRASSVQSNPFLLEALRTEIRAAGGRGIPFATFMARVLYHPEWGYYAGGAARVGRAGDFFTSVSVGDCFGILLARHVTEVMGLLPGDGAFHIVEQGANDGRLARDILVHLRLLLPEEDFARIRYAIIEPFPRLRKRQRATLKEKFGSQVVHFAGIEGVAGKCERGLFLSNELLDAFPVHRVVFETERWREIHVVEKEDGFGESAGDLSDPRLTAALKGLSVAEGYRTEICLAASEWMREAASIFGRGLVTVIDYGLVEEAYFSPERNEGTLRGYREHRLVEDLYDGIGETDLTAHVNFSHLARSARASGLDVLGFCEQGRFLVGQAADWMGEIEAAGAPDARTASLIRQFQTLIHPGMMGRAFQILTFGKNVGTDAARRLTGFQHAGEGAAGLG